MNKIPQYIAILFLLLSCGKEEKSLFDMTPPKKTGITFQNTLTETDSLNIQTYLYFYNGGGTAIGDIDNDGLPDIFLSGNQVDNKLYLNKGNLEFEDISMDAGIEGDSSWNTGAVMADVNGDGLLDIYVLAVTGIHGFEGHNELYINNGPSKGLSSAQAGSGTVTFTESAEEYGLDFKNFGTSAAFFDYDRDGDLDVYLLNHAVHTQESLDYVDIRLQRDVLTGDKLLRNDGGHFTDVSEEARIYGGANGYGLGVAVADFNNDGWPDLYVGNDFQEDDYYYLNDQKGGFTERGSEAFGQFSRFSMGNDVADINRDGWPDLITLDMLPEDESVLKASESDGNVQTELLRTLEYGYHHQFSRNMLHINQGGSAFSETALLSGIAATDWSWSALFADYDQDGRQDLFISNGIVKRPNDLDYINYYSSLHFQRNDSNQRALDRKGLELMPSGAVPNQMFKGIGNLRFKERTDLWIGNLPTVSGATAMGDLDNDGDVDLVVNNINGPATLYINTINTDYNYLKIKIDYKDGNHFGLGTKIFSYHNGIRQYKELFTSRGFQSSSEPMLHFGYGKAKQIDSLRIIWPDGTTQTAFDVSVNQTLVISPEDTEPFDYATLRPEIVPLFERVDGNLGIDFTPLEPAVSDFNRHRLLPYAVSQNRPEVGIGDFTHDGTEDIVIGDFRNVYVQRDTTFLKEELTPLGDSISESTVALNIADFNKDGEDDILMVFRNGLGQTKSEYLQAGKDGYAQTALPDCFENNLVLAPSDFDGDGDLDVFVGNRSVADDFGKIPDSYLLENREGKFHIKSNSTLGQIGMVSDAVWSDFDGDGGQDLIVVGEWMPPRFFRNSDGQLSEVQVLEEGHSGLWQRILPFDIDKDGNTDYLLGNWGLNSKFKASRDYPLKMYYSDFDKNGATETIIATEKNGKYYPLENFSELSEQLVSLRRRFTSYKAFAGKSMDEIFDRSVLDSSEVLTANELASGYLKNEGGRFEFVPFDNKLQTAPIKEFVKYDFDGDGSEEVLAAGNFFGLKPYHGRLGAFPGALIENEREIASASKIGLDFLNRSVASMKVITLNGASYLLVTFYDTKAQVYHIRNNSDGIDDGQFPTRGE
jgi:hypothetical protein